MKSHFLLAAPHFPLQLIRLKCPRCLCYWVSEVNTEDTTGNKRGVLLITCVYVVLVPSLTLSSCHPSLCDRTAALMSGAPSSPASQRDAAVAMATGPCATASVVMSTTTAPRWGRQRRRICTRRLLRPSTHASAVPRSWCAPWRRWSGAAPPPGQNTLSTCSLSVQDFLS